MASGQSVPGFFAVAIALCVNILTPSPDLFAQERLTIKPDVKPWSLIDERPESPSALGRFDGNENALAASRRRAESMGGGMEQAGRWHLTIRRLYQLNSRGLPASETMEYAAEDLSPSFDEPESLVADFQSALAGNEIVAFADLLGLRAEKLLDDGAALQTFVAIRNGVAEKLEIDGRQGSQILLIGEERLAASVSCRARR
jgi:hypothetical protein